MAIFKNVTSVGITDDNGVKVIAYSYDEIDDVTGERKRLNCKGSRIIVKSNSDALAAVKTLEDLAQTFVDSE